MIDICNGIDSLSNFKRRTPEFIRQMKETGEAVVLTVNGKAEIVVQDAASYQRLLAMAERLRSIEGLQMGLDDVAAGRTRPLVEFDAEMRAKYGIPR
ncbi:MAG TPA: type II toxin-antitoxin system Phd/YefM family antitoxin [Chthonomonadaceae bacterium]|nr:type II toxin-antitoxin system Phd/YefM family antitoxin [Chthonomonadaceae bacterium]